MPDYGYGGYDEVQVPVEDSAFTKPKDPYDSEARHESVRVGVWERPGGGAPLAEVHRVGLRFKLTLIFDQGQVGYGSTSLWFNDRSEMMSFACMLMAAAPHP